MCLYAALSLTVETAIQARAAAADGVTDEDACPLPDWGARPSKSYRLSVDESGIRPARSGQHTTDAAIFDPRVWTDETRDAFRSLLRRTRPHVLLISTVSAGHRHALEMAAIAKQESPGCLIVMGGRHVDETIRQEADGVTFAYSSTVRAMLDGRALPVVDVLVGGDGAFALDLVMRAICRAMRCQTMTASPLGVVAALHELGMRGERLPGTAVVVIVDGSSVHAFPIRGRPYDLDELPSPYASFAIRSRFPVFPGRSGVPKRTAHMITAVSCPYRCAFCSESMAVTGAARRFPGHRVDRALARLCEYVHYGAEAIFFDDSVFWSGNLTAALRFSELLASGRESRGESLPRESRAWLRDPDDLDRLVELEWGAQFTVDLLATVHDAALTTSTLSAIRQAGCSYLYIGIESMSDVVMDRIHKNLRRGRSTPWASRVRLALERAKSAGLRIGTAVLFGLDGETRGTIEETVAGIGRLLDEGLLELASPNILTYHPAAPITAQHGMQDRLDYHSTNWRNRAPYTFFEEAYPGVVSRTLSEEDVWYIHELTKRHWGKGRHGADLDLEPFLPADSDVFSAGVRA